jgi:hypothetical protein
MRASCLRGAVRVPVRLFKGILSSYICNRQVIVVEGHVDDVSNFRNGAEVVGFHGWMKKRPEGITCGKEKTVVHTIPNN